MMTPAPIASELRSPRGADTTEIDWSDGHRGVYPHAVLRGFCPCATCQGHEGPIKYRAGGSLEIGDIEEVGNYALRFVWGDGHGTGLYSFRFLRVLCACDECAHGAMQDRIFSR